MTPDEVPAGPLLVDTDVVSWLALDEARADDFGTLMLGHEFFVSFVTVAEVRTLLAMDTLTDAKREALSTGLEEYPVLPVPVDAMVSEWVKLRAATIPGATIDDRERRQNDTWIAACALSVSPTLPLVTGNLRDFTPLAENSELKLVHPDL
ncbi:MAG: hypothetical protein J2O48_00895 [Solirubrobacterales bacterium]|nr:hypothetical protein [Solirubrobacterales bacterium]